MNYETLYHNLFNAITDALEEIPQQKYSEARQRLMEAQQKTEMIYINADPEP